MQQVRHVVVLDAADVGAVSRFWAGVFDGVVVDEDPAFHCVIDGHGNWVIGVQRAPDHVRPSWPDGEPQQVHLDLHVADPVAAHRQVIDLGAEELGGNNGFDDDDGHRVYADPAGHPFCIGWGHPNPEQLATFLAGWSPAAD